MRTNADLRVQSWGAPSALLAFEDEAERERVHALLMRQPQLGSALTGSSALQRGALLEGRGSWLLHAQAAWVSGKVSNFDYLLYLNLAAGRTFNVLSLWPVFPWILADYDTATLDLDSAASFRDFSKPMGALGHPARLSECRCAPRRRRHRRRRSFAIVSLSAATSAYGSGNSCGSCSTICARSHRSRDEKRRRTR